MAPYVHESAGADPASEYSTSKEQVKKPVEDNFMYDFKYNHSLPTTEVLGVEIPTDCDARKEAEGIVAQLSKATSEGDAQAFAGLFLDYGENIHHKINISAPANFNYQGVWRDKLSFTWDFQISNFSSLRQTSPDRTPTSLNCNSSSPSETEIVFASAVINAVLTKDGWRIYTMHTVAEGLKQFPEQPAPDGHMTGITSWESQRAEAINTVDPEVLIIGGGQNGLAMAARLKVLGMENLIIERMDEIGDIWKSRYEYLSLHFPHWPDALPYFKYPQHWPTYTPAQKQGLYMKWYASALELNVWTKSEVVNAEQDAEGRWTVLINKEGKETRTLHPKQIIMATSLCGVPFTPDVPGMTDFRGVIRHSSAHKSSRDFIGKKVCVMGSSSSGFDTAYECARLGIDVTLLQRSPTYVMSLTHSVPRMLGRYMPNKTGKIPDIEVQDRVNFCTPVGPGEEIAKRLAKDLEDLDRPLLEALNARGLRTWRGQRDTGNHTLGQTRNGGFYFDAGACDEIINGNVKVEPGYIETFTENKVILNGGREKEFDLVIFATGFSNMIDSIKATLGENVASRCGPIWGIDEEGEYRTAFRETGVPNMWIMVGFLPLTRYASKLLALRLKALKGDVSPPPYKV
ncbi:hypothetical protein ZTR_04947 [Talaromyces verruculosus]|nr:hypothetical protein ZTR_04947 [Talaromyces verruculosus]